MRGYHTFNRRLSSDNNVLVLSGCCDWSQVHREEEECGVINEARKLTNLPKARGGRLGARDMLALAFQGIVDALQFSLRIPNEFL